MKRLLFILLLFLTCFSANAQLGCGAPEIEFDPGDTTPIHGIYYINWLHYITIDTLNYHHNTWQVGAPHKTVFTSAYTLPNAIVTDTLNPYPVNDTSVFTLRLPVRNDSIAPLLQLEFTYCLNKDSGSIAKFEISLDSGLNWVNTADSLPPGFGYNGVPFNLSLNTTGWTPFWLDIEGCGSCLGDSIILFRFTFISDSVTTAKDGWIIDNIVMFYPCDYSNVAQIQNNTFITVYPNPATTSLTITSPQNITNITITNLIGQTVYNHEYSSSQIQVDVADLPTGIYFIKVNGSAVRKFVKE